MNFPAASWNAPGARRTRRRLGLVDHKRLSEGVGENESSKPRRRRDLIDVFDLTVRRLSGAKALEKFHVTPRRHPHGFDYSGFLSGGHKTLAGAANYVLGLKDGKKRFADLALAMSRAFTLCCTLEEAKAVREEVAFFQAVKVILANNESAVRELTDETLKKIAHELAESLRKNLTVDWSARESVQAKLRLMVKRILRKYKYPPDQQEAAVELVLQQAKALGEAWA